LKKNITIQNDKIFVVEGADDRNFLMSFIEKEFPDSDHKFTDNFVSEICQIIELEGIDPLSDKIKGIISLPNFYNVKKMAVFIDADQSVDQKFQSAQSAFRRNNLPIPKEIGKFFTHNESHISIGVYIVQVNGKGMLETMCLKSVESDPAFECLNSFWACLENLFQNESLSKPKNCDKARCLSYLSTRKEISNSLGIGAKKGYWNFSHHIFDDLRTFVKETLNDKTSISK
jgi:hypothetical protein